VRDVQIEMDIVSRRPRSHRDRTRKKKFVLQHDTVREEDEENWVESEVESVSRRNLPSVPTT